MPIFIEKLDLCAIDGLLYFQKGIFSDIIFANKKKIQRRGKDEEGEGPCRNPNSCAFGTYLFYLKIVWGLNQNNKNMQRNKADTRIATPQRQQNRRQQFSDL